MTNFDKNSFFKKLTFLGYIIFVLLLIYVSFKIAVFLSPFVLAILFSIIVTRISKFLQSKFKINKKVSIGISLFILFTLLFGLIGFVITKLILEIYSLSINISSYSQEIRLWINSILDFMNRGTIILDKIPEQILAQLKNSSTQFVSMGTAKISILLNNILYFITSLPNVIIFLFVTVIATIFMSMDKQNIIIFVEKQLPPSWLKKIYTLKNDLLSYRKLQVVFELDD